MAGLGIATIGLVLLINTVITLRLKKQFIDLENRVQYLEDDRHRDITKQFARMFGGHEFGGHEARVEILIKNKSRSYTREKEKNGNL